MADEILWPLRAVSKDPTNLTKLDADNNVLTSSTDLDARYVNLAGDTMTGDLEITGNIVSTGTAHNFAPNSIPVSAISGLSASGLNPLTIGTAPAITTQEVDAVGLYILRCASIAGNRIALRYTPQTGVLELNPLSANGRTTITGDIVLGPTASTVANTASTGVSGQFKWDDSFIYLRTTTGWKKVALAAI